MFRNSFQQGFVSLFSSNGSKPLAIWDVHAKNGHSRRLTDEDLRSLTFELIGVNVATTYMVAPCAPWPSLSIKLPFLVMHVKNLRKFFTFEVQILDDSKSLRRLRFSNYQSGPRMGSFSTSMPLTLAPNWNQLQLNLADFTRRTYGTNYVEAVRVQVHANVRIKRIYFCDRLYPNDETPNDLRLFPSIRPCALMHLRNAAANRAKHPDEPIETVRPPTPVGDTEETNPEEGQTARSVAIEESEEPTVPTDAPDETVQSTVQFEDTEDTALAEQTVEEEPVEQQAT